MNGKPDREKIVSYYDDHVKNKLNDYIKYNPRIEYAWNTVTKYAPGKPVRILEVGCGMGSICGRMHDQWPQSIITGIDISTQSIQIAQKLFSNDKVDFKESILTPDTFDEQFDLIVFMDVYEHIAVEDRTEVHLALLKILRNKGRIILTVPTPYNLKWSLKNKPETMQPVDEHITFDVVAKLARDTGTEIMLYEVKSVWNIGDYTHIILEKNDNFEGAFFYNKPITLTQRAFRITGKIKSQVGSFFRRIYVRRKLGR
jgi:2-polyprenyl-3-methyl-5-hydroxy-6-metoxy-1,4-benzoquinol methylase